MKMHDYRLLQLLSIVQVITITDYNIPMSAFHPQNQNWSLATLLADQRQTD